MIKVDRTEKAAGKTFYHIESNKKGLPEAKIYKEADGTWTIRYKATTKFKHNLESYYAAINHLTRLGW